MEIVAFCGLQADVSSDYELDISCSLRLMVRISFRLGEEACVEYKYGCTHGRRMAIRAMARQ